jgi:antitoxin MazE
MGMITTVQRWGNSLALRIPKAFASQANLMEDARVDLIIRGDTIIVRPARKEWSLDEMLKQITTSNRHAESEWGGPEGNELW